METSTDYGYIFTNYMCFKENVKGKTKINWICVFNFAKRRM